MSPYSRELAATRYKQQPSMHSRHDAGRALSSLKSTKNDERANERVVLIPDIHNLRLLAVGMAGPLPSARSAAFGKACL